MSIPKPLRWFFDSMLGYWVLLLAISLGAVLMLVVDMDRAQDGFLQTGQQPLIDLQQDIVPP